MANKRRTIIDGKQYCSRCGELKPLDAFHKNKAYFSGYVPECKSCVRIRHAKHEKTDEYKKAHSEWARGYRKTERGKEILKANDLKKHLRGKYHMSLEEYDNLLIKQNGLCAICGKPPQEFHVRTSNGKREYMLNRLLVDHDHNTQKVRGLLCRQCNCGIGYFKDDTALMAKAIQYLIECK